MFNRTNAITICTKKEYAIDMETLTSKYIKTNDIVQMYRRGDDVFITIHTKFKVEKVKAIIEEKLYRAELTIKGNTIFVDFDEG